MEQNQLIALGILIFSLSIIILKRLSMLALWEHNKCDVVTHNKLDIDEYEVLYVYMRKGRLYRGRMVEHFNNDDKKRDIYIHKLNPHISVPKIPISHSDICLIILGSLAGLYLYLYQCECLPENVNTILGIPNKN